MKDKPDGVLQRLGDLARQLDVARRSQRQALTTARKRKGGSGRTEAELKLSDTPRIERRSTDPRSLVCSHCLKRGAAACRRTVPGAWWGGVPPKLAAFRARSARRWFDSTT